MNKTAILIVLVVAVALTMGQGKLRRKNGREGRSNLNRVIESRGGEAVNQNSLKAGEKHHDAFQGLLQKKAAKQARLAKKSERKQKRKEAARAAEAQKLQAEATVDFETYDKKQDFHNLDAAANKKSENTFGLQLTSQNRNQENAAIKENSGYQANSGTKFSALESIDAAKQAEHEAVHEDEFLDANNLEAEEADEDSLNAQEAAKTENEAFVDSQSFNRRSDGFTDDFFGEESIGGLHFNNGNDDFFPNQGNSFGKLFGSRK